MKKFVLLITIGITIFGCSALPQTVSELKNQINKNLGTLEGEFAVAFRNLSDTSQTVFINEDEMFHAASTMKTPD